LLATAADDGADQIRLWEVATRKEIRRFGGRPQGHSPTAFAFSPDGQTLAAGGMRGGQVVFWEVATGKELRSAKAHQHIVHAMVFSADGKTLTSGSYDGTICITEVATGKELYKFQVHKEPTWAIAFSPDGKLAAVGNQEQGEPIRLWDVTAGKELRQIDRQGGAIRLAFSPDGKSLLSTGGARSFAVWDVATGRERQQARVEGFPFSVAISLDGSLVALGCHDHTDRIYTVRLWDLAADKELPPLDGHVSHIAGLAFSPDGKVLASGSYDTTILLWDVASLRQGKRRE
jgi:WD40 repeat protein